MAKDEAELEEALTEDDEGPARETPVIKEAEPRSDPQKRQLIQDFIKEDQ